MSTAATKHSEYPEPSNPDQDPKYHRLQRADAKSRKTFKIKRHRSTIKGTILRSATTKTRPSPTSSEMPANGGQNSDHNSGGTTPPARPLHVRGKQPSGFVHVLERMDTEIDETGIHMSLKLLKHTQVLRSCNDLAL